MIINPVIPIWLMIIICIALLLIRRNTLASNIRKTIAILLIFITNLRIMVPDDNVTYQERKLDTNVLFVIDNTISMLAQDYDGKDERLTGVKEDCNYIIEKLAGANFAVITFDFKAKQFGPYSNNTEFVKSTIDSIYPLNELYAKGTSMNIWKDLTLKVTKSAKENRDGDVVVFFISDGEMTADEDLDSFDEIAEYIDGGAVLGYGTSKGGEMEMEDVLSEDGEKEKIMDSDNRSKPAVSKIDEDNLEDIAKDLNVEYINMNSPEGLDKILDDIVRKSNATDEDAATRGYKDIFYVFLVPLLLLMMYEFLVLKRSIK